LSLIKLSTGFCSGDGGGGGDDDDDGDEEEA